MTQAGPGMNGKAGSRGRRRGRAVRWFARAVVAGIVVALGLAAGATVLLRASLPRTGGSARLAGLSAPVEIERDGRGVVTIRAANLLDAARAQGFVHAQERFFQLDLSRRYAAGELSEVVGGAALPTDRRMRVYRFRDVAGRAFARLRADHRALLEAYAAGVNAGLADLGAWPPEYLALRSSPRAWTPEDSLLVVLMMFDGLSVDKESELRLATMDRALPRELVEFLTPDRTRFDAPLAADGSVYEPAAVPGPGTVDLRTVEVAPLEGVQEPRGLPMGSNNFALAGSRTTHGGAIVGNDMHLRISVPQMWMRMQLEWTDESGASRRAAGVTLPGAPSIVGGATEFVAWGFTNATGDFHDFVVVEPAGDDAGSYMTAEGPERFAVHEEAINVRGGRGETLLVRTTRWGPVVVDSFLGGPALALKWTALEPEAINLDIFDMLGARTLEEGIDAASRWQGPPQNVLVGDATGRIGWVVSGFLPKRVGFDGTRPVSWAKPNASGVVPAWDGQEERPRLLDPPGGALATANNRVAPIELARRYGRQWALPHRAARMAALLAERAKHDERELLAVQLDTRSELYDFYRDLVLEAVDAEDADARLRAAREVVATWSGKADPPERAFPILAHVRTAVHRRIFAGLVAPCREMDEKFAYAWFLAEEPARRLLEERPEHLLPPGDASWRDALRGAVADALDALEKRFPGRYGGAAAEKGDFGVPWSDVNRARVAHPVSAAAPMLARWLDMPRDPLPGHWSTVRVATPGFGASQRMVASPGRPESAILHTPVGQSGHFLSRHYSDTWDDWLSGAATPMWAQPAESRFTLTP